MEAESSMLELLSVTDAAVKALNKSTRSNSLASSKSSHSSRGSASNRHERDKMVSPESTSSRHSRDKIHSPDSGICKTYTATDDKGQKIINGHQEDFSLGGNPLERSSDESTTASDVLIRSTLADPNENSFHDIGQNASNVSKYSKSSFGADNFNSSGPQKVKISTKRLREIKSPFENNRSPRNTTDVPPALSNVDKNKKALPGGSKKFSPESNNRNYIKNDVAKTKVPQDLIQTLSMESDNDTDTSNTGNPSKVIPSQNTRGQSNLQVSGFDDKRHSPKFPGDKGNRIDSSQNGKPHKALTDSQKELSKHVDISHRSDKKNSPRSEKSGSKLEDSSKYLIERHLHVQDSKDTEISPPLVSVADELENDGKHNASIDLIPSKENGENDVSGSSGSLSQPEIITVPERIVTVSARTSVSASDISASDSGTLEDEKIPPKLPTRFYAFNKTHGVCLPQGAPIEGVDDPDKQKQSDAVHISKYSLSDKEKMVKQTFFKRYEQAGPVRRVVQPKIVGDKKGSTEKTTDGATTSQSNDVLTAAVAASAAVAATQPFLKAQNDLETKMAEILERIAEVQGKGGQEKESSRKDNDRVSELEKQLSAMTEQRIGHLERLQEQQLQMQAKLLSLTRATPETRPLSPMSYSRRSLSPPRRPDPQDVQKKAFSKTKINEDHKGKKSQYQSDNEDHIMSPFDTPAPRSRAPRPVAYDTSDIDLGSGSKSLAKDRDQNSRGILEEILASAESPRRGIPTPIMPTRWGQAGCAPCLSLQLLLGASILLLI